VKRAELGRARRVVVKLGTSLLTRRAAACKRAASPRSRSRSPSRCARPRDRRGRVGCRRARHAAARPRKASELDPGQASRRGGRQIDLCRRFERAFAREKLLVGQILLDHAGFVDRERFLNARRTLSQLLADRVVPLINENDSVATEELRFGDNDQLAAQVVNTCGADLLILLTDVDGLRDGDPARVARRASRRCRK